jgi:hypothetical protein
MRRQDLRNRLCFLLAAASGCSGASNSSTTHSDFLRLDSDVSLETLIIRDSVKAGEPVQFWVILKNGGSPLDINNHPDRLDVHVEGTSGQHIDTTQMSSVDVFLGATGRFVLPREAAFGRLLTLDCIGSGYGQRAGCYYGYRLSDPGRYRIITTFRGLPIQEGHERFLVDTAIVNVRE